MTVPDEQLHILPETRESYKSVDLNDTAVAVGRRRVDSLTVARADFLALETNWEPQTLTLLATVGQGRAAQARLVEAIDRNGECRLCVEKLFRPPLLTRLIYRIAFQAPFAYQWCDEAIVASFYRRRVAAVVVEALLPTVRVARPLYVRWDKGASAFVLGTEFVNGRGIIPQGVDRYVLRRGFARLLRTKRRWPLPPPEEVKQLLTTMDELEHLFRECGLVGSGWQVCKRALVSTANFRRSKQGYVLVDLESGIPALLVWSYVLAGLRLRSFPLFDDIDANRLRQWLAAHQNRFTQAGDGAHERLHDDIEKLTGYTERWKKGELALVRNGLKIFSRESRDIYRIRCVSVWRRRKIIDADAERLLETSDRFFSRPTYWFGLIPGPPGRFLQRLVANHAYRAALRRWLFQSRYRKTWARWHVRRHACQWREAGRIAPNRKFSGLSPGFLGNALLARCSPPGFHRWLSDPIVRNDWMGRIFLLCASAQFQQVYARHVVNERIREWRRDERIGGEEAESLSHGLKTHDLDEYLRCFGLHLGLKLSSPLILPMKVGGVATFVATGNLIYLLPFLFTPIGRTAITLWRMVKHRGTQYGEALLVGMIPAVGNLAYPAQMYAAYPDLSTFLIRDSAARAARWMPIYGGKDTRVEIWFLKLMNLFIEATELGVTVASRIRRTLSRKPRQVPEVRAVTSSPRFEKLLQRQLQLLASSRTFGYSFGDWALTQTRAASTSANLARN